MNSCCKDCKANDLKAYFRKKCSTVFSKAINNNNNNCLSIIGCDAQFLMSWFEFQFDKDMNWTNYGSYWQLDHVKACSLFDLTNNNDRRLMNHFFNLQPLEKHENITKSNKYNDEIELNHTTKILRFLDYLNKTDSDLYKFATESYNNLS